ncbi:hypothetical protein BJV78DRAFT_1277267 [Lactifluus subvellereus]|nr:hypothetical protein BJV78DRAFT_1277267 [Lactifluus subvellereus]
MVSVVRGTNTRKTATGVPMRNPSLVELVHIFIIISICCPEDLLQPQLHSIFISFFFKQPRKKIIIKVAAGSCRQAEEVIIVDNGDSEVESDEDEAIEEEAAVSADAEEGDNGQIAHDNSVVKTLQGRAIQIMKDQGIVIENEDKKIALQLFPCVAGLAHRVHDSATLKEKFDKLVQEDDELEGNKKALDRRVTTWWNSDLTCLEAHVHFKNVIQQLTGVATNKLQAYRLSDQQWDLADDLIEALMIFDAPTKLFLQSQVPLIVDAVPMLEEIEESMVAVRDADDEKLPTVIRVAAQAALLLIDKYSIFTSDCELYQIAIVMCPDHKLKWFKDHRQTAAQIKEIKKLVIKCWEESYRGVEDEAQVQPDETQPPKV